jgi:hypothetical protein
MCRGVLRGGDEVSTGTELSSQAEGTNAKPYQVRQVLRLIEEHKLEVQWCNSRFGIES